MKRAIILVLVPISFLLASSTDHKKACSCHSTLTNNQTKYWDAKAGYNWLFNTDSTFEEFVYTSSTRDSITKPDRGDVIISGKRKWSCSGDTLYMYYSYNYIVKYPIVKLSNKELIVLDLSKAWGWDTLHFSPAKNQKMKLPEW